jgi:hypothetical protein
MTLRRWIACTLALCSLSGIAFVATLQAADLRSPANQADYIFISPAPYLAETERLATFRHQHDGIATMVVPLDSILAQFTVHATPDSAIKDFLECALTQWASPRATYVLLVGNVNCLPTHVEPENPGFVYLGYADTVCIDHWFVEGPQDQWGIGTMRCALGRLPGWDRSEITTMVDKIIGYDLADPASWWGRCIGLADYSDLEGSLFADDLHDLQRLTAPVWTDTVSVIMDSLSASYRDSLAFRQLWDEGAALVVYSGHANAYTWSVQHFFTAISADALRNGPRLPLVLSLGCAMRFEAPGPSMTVRLLRNPQGGAIACIVSQGITYLSSSSEFVAGTLERLRSNPALSAGVAFRQTKDSLSGSILRRFTFLGDPAVAPKRPGVIASRPPLSAVPEGFRLEQNYPNPFNPSTTIRYRLSGRLRVRLTVYNALGQQSAVLQNGEQDGGDHEVRFDGSNLPSGVYFYRMQAGSFTATKCFLLLK